MNIPLTVPGPAVTDRPAAPAAPTAAAALATPGMPGAAYAYDVDTIRRDFPILAEHVNGHPLVWLDNAATTQKPQEVIDRLTRFYCHENSNVHRGAHELATRATQAYEDARASVAQFLGAPSPDDIVFVRGATEAINLVAQSWGRAQIHAGDEVVVSCLEHHANIVPWQLLAEERGARLRVIPVDDNGQIILDEYRRLLTERTRLVAIAHVSNALGTIVPLREVIDAAHSAGARVLVDGAQAVAHAPVDVQQLDPDFYVFSGHKVYGPTGIGALYGKADVLDTMRPWQGGGNMIRDVTFERTTYQPPPARFEAGTGSIADAAGLATALGYVERIGRREHRQVRARTARLRDAGADRCAGPAPDRHRAGQGGHSVVRAGRVPAGRRRVFIHQQGDSQSEVLQLPSGRALEQECAVVVAGRLAGWGAEQVRHQVCDSGGFGDRPGAGLILPSDDAVVPGGERAAGVGGVKDGHLQPVPVVVVVSSARQPGFGEPTGEQGCGSADVLRVAGPGGRSGAGGEHGVFLYRVAWW